MSIKIKDIMTYLRFSIVTILLLFSLSTIKSANITGCVIDDANAPVEFATIVFLKGDKQIAGTTTSDNGCFHQSIACGTYEIRVSYVGLSSYVDTILVNESKELGKITLKKESTNLKEVTVTASPIRREADKFVMQLEGQPTVIGKNGEEILKEAPGVWIDTDDKISINGNGGTKVYINDREQNMSNEQLMNFLRSLSAEDISKIEVIPRAGAEYSANTTGGIIKITLKSNKDNGIMGSVGTSFSADKNRISYSPNANLNIKNGKWSVNASTWWFSRPKSKQEANEITTYTNSKLTSNSVLEENGETYGGGKLGAIYDIDKNNSLGFEGQYTMSHDPINLNTTSDFLINNVNTQTKSNYITKTNGYNWNLKFNYIHKLDTLGSTLKFLLNYTYDHNKSDANNRSIVEINESKTDSIFRNDTKARYNVLNGSIDLDKAINKQWRVSAGVKYTLNDMYNFAYYDYQKEGQWIPEINSNYNINYNENIYALYAIANFSSGRWQIKGGLRGEYTNSTGSGGFIGKNYFDLFPNANINYSLTEKGDYSINIGYSRKIERPSFWAMSPIRYQISDYSYQTGNPLLKPSYQNDIDFNLSMAYKYNLSIGGFFSNDGINQQMAIDKDDPRYMSITWVNETQIRGFYVSAYAPITITKWLNLTPNITYVLRGEKKNGEDDSFNYYNLLFANANLTVTLPKNFYIESEAYYQKKMTMGNVKIGNMVFWGLGVKKTFNDNKWVTSLKVSNILSQDMSITGVGDNFNRNYKLKQYPSIKMSVTYNFNSGKKFKARDVESNEDASRLSKGSGNGR